MNLTHYVPWRLASPLAGLLYSDGFDRAERPQAWRPAVDIREEAERFVLHADLPGVEPAAIEISLEDGVLTLRGERHSATEETGDGFRRSERLTGSFQRRFTLPDTADAEGIQARSTHGVLEIVIPKLAKPQARRITVQA